MVFVDLLTSQLFTTGITGLLLLYGTAKAYFIFRKAGKKLSPSVPDIISEMSNSAIPLGFLGLYGLITALYGQFTWPLPGSYNILYYDIFALFNVLILSLAYALLKKNTFELEYIGLFALVFGFIAILYGATAYSLSLSTEPLAVLGLYTSFGLAGIFSYPFALIVKKITRAGGAKITNPQLFITVLFWLFLLLGSALAIFIGGAAVGPHLLKAP